MNIYTPNNYLCFGYLNYVNPINIQEQKYLL